MAKAEIRLLGGFEIRVDDRSVDETDFERRLAASLVKLLALQPGRRLHREQVIDALWPDRAVDDAAPQLHKMASYVRKAVGDKQAIELRDDLVMLWPDAEIEIDVDAFDRADDSDPAAAAALYVGDLLPDDPYEEWLGGARDRLRARHLSLLRAAEDWERLLEVEPADEEAHLELMRGFADAGQRRAALRQFERLERVLHEDLGVSPSPEAVDLRNRVVGDESRRTGLVGRDEERAVLQRALDDATAGSGGLIVLTGPAGIGKSALAEWVGGRGSDLGFVVGRGQAASVDGGWPYAAVLEAAGAVLRASPDVLDSLPESHRDELVRVREVSAIEPAAPDGSDGHQRLFVAVDALLDAAAESGVVLMIDDLHLADAATLSLLTYLARRARTRKTVIIGTARTQPDSAGVAEVRRFLSETGGRELPVGPMNAADSASLVASLITDAALDSGPTVGRILDLAGGTPFYLEELARTVAEGSARALPETAAALAGASLEGLAPEVRETLQRIAVAGLHFDTDEFVALAGVDENEAFRLLDGALDGHAIEYTESGYRFRHGLVRERLLDELPPHRRRVVHREAAERLQATGASPARVAHHLVAGGAAQEAAPWALKAATAASSVGAYVDARAMIEPVLDHSDGEVRVGLLMQYADVLAAMSDPGTLVAYQRALDAVEGPMERLVRAKMVRAALMFGEVELAGDLISGLQPDGGPFDGAILQAQGMFAYMTRDLDTAEVRAAEARQFALGDASGGMLDVLTLQGMVAHDRGEWFDRMGRELTLTADSKELAATVFDCHL